MKNPTELSQRLLELVYGLVPEDEASRLMRRIEAEPATASAFADANRLAGLLAEASRLDLPGRLSTPEHVRDVPRVVNRSEIQSCDPVSDAASERYATIVIDQPVNFAPPLRKVARRSAGLAVLLATACALVIAVLFVGRTEKPPHDGAEAIAAAGLPADPAEWDLLVALPRPDVEEPLAAVGETLTTGDRERRRVALADGSVVYLNENTSVAVESERRLRVAQGEVFVEVAQRPATNGRTEPHSVREHDVAADHEEYATAPQQPSEQETASRLRFGRSATPSYGSEGDSAGKPFVVATRGREVVALGTKFVVIAADQPDAPALAVVQGRVQAEDYGLPVTAGQQLVPAAPDAGDELALVPSARSSELLAWTRGLHESAETPLVPESPHAGGALVAIDPQGQETKLSLRRYHVDVHIQDGFARTTIDQTYFNHEQQQLEGTFYFPLPADASLSRLAMYVAGRKMEGGMVERDYARNVFEEIRYARRDPALLEWVDGSTFKMRVFPLEARHEKRLLLSYTQRLPSAYGRTTYRFPAGHNLEVAGAFSTEIRLKDGAGHKWHSPSHELKARVDGNDLVLDAKSKRTVIERDIVLEVEGGELRVEGRKDAAIDGEKKRDAGAARLSAYVQDGQRYLMLRMRPELPGELVRPRRDFTILFEATGDRDPLLARVQIDTVQTILDHAEHSDTFALVVAGTTARPFAEEPLPCTPDNIAEAVMFLEQTHLIGALDLGAALDGCAPFIMSADNPCLLHIGAGVPILGNRRTDELAQGVASLGRAPSTKDKTPPVTYVGVPVGHRWSRDFMETAARLTGGLVWPINPDEEVMWKAFELVSTLNAPRLVNLHVTDAAGREFLTFARQIAQGEELCAVARIPENEPVPKSLIVTGELVGTGLGAGGGPDDARSPDADGVVLRRADGEPWKRTIAIDETAIADGAGYLPRSWARLEIDRLLAEDAVQHQPQIVELSKSMYVMSPYTSLLVLESEAMYAQYGVDRGRSDHWAMYAAPEQIEVIHEPVTPALVEAEPVRAPTPVELEDRQLAEDVRRLRDSIVVRPHPAASARPAVVQNLSDELPLAWSAPNVWWERTAWPSLAVDNRGFLGSGMVDRFTGATEFAEAAAERNLFEDSLLRRRLLESGLQTDLASALHDARALAGFAPPDARVDVKRLEQKLEAVTDTDNMRLLGLLAQIDPAAGQARANLDEVERLDELAARRLAGITQNAEPRWRAGQTLREEALTRLRRRSAVAARDVESKWHAQRTELWETTRLLEDLGTIEQVQAGDAGRGLLPQNTLRGDTLQSINRFDGRHSILADMFGRGVYYSQDVNSAFSPDGQRLTAGGRSGWGWSNPSAPAMDFDLYFRHAAPDVYSLQAGSRHGVNNLYGYVGPSAFLDTNGNDYSVPFGNVPESSLAGPNAGFGFVRPDVPVERLLAPIQRVPIQALPHFDGASDYLPPVQLSVTPRDLSRLFLKERAGEVDTSAVLFGSVLVDSSQAGKMVLNGIFDQEQLLTRTYSVADLVIPVQAEADPVRCLADLVVHAPGLNTNWSDVAAILQQELPSTLTSQSGDASPTATTATVDPEARQLIEQARHRGWEAVTLPGSNGTTITVTCDGGGRFVYERLVSEGLRETVVCDGESLLHLYPEIGLGARRTYSRFHRAEFQALVPWSVPSVEELTRNADVQLIGERTIAVVPRVTPIHEESASPRPELAVQLVFAPDARLTERRLVRTGTGDVAARWTYAADGTVRLLDEAGDVLIELAFRCRPAAEPDLQPDLSELVVLPLPYRSEAWVEQHVGALAVDQADDSSQADAARLAHVAAAFAAGAPARLRAILDREFFHRDDQRPGFYTLLLAAAAARGSADGEAAEALRALALNVDLRLAGTALGRYLRDAAQLALQGTVATPEGAQQPATDFLSRLAEARSVYTLWTSANPADHERWTTAAEQERAIRVIRDSRSDDLAWLLLHEVVIRTQDGAFLGRLADVAQRFDDAPGLSTAARFRRSGWLEQAGRGDEARSLIRDTYMEALENGVLLTPDSRCVAAVGESSETRRRWRKTLRKLHGLCLDAGLRPAALRLAIEAHRMQDPALADTLLDRTLAAVVPLDDPEFSALASAGLMTIGEFARADALLTPLLEHEQFRDIPSLWQQAAEAARGNGELATAAIRLDRANDLDHGRLPETVDLAAFRTQYATLLTTFRDAADNASSTDDDLPDDFIGRVLRAADRWRQIDPDDTAACQAAAGVLNALGRQDLAWAYVTTPLGQRPNEAEPWTALAAHLQTNGDTDRAADAYATAFEIEPTNAQILWDQAQLLETAGQPERARALYRKLADGKWQPRFEGVQAQARERLGE